MTRGQFKFHGIKLSVPWKIRYCPPSWWIQIKSCHGSDYELNDRAIGVRSPAGAKDFSSSLYVQTGSGAHPASCTIGTGGPFSGGKARLGRDAEHSPPSTAEVVNE
jgi:hypothetical protein